MIQRNPIHFLYFLVNLFDLTLRIFRKLELKACVHPVLKREVEREVDSFVLVKSLKKIVILSKRLDSIAQ